MSESDIHSEKASATSVNISTETPTDKTPSLNTPMDRVLYMMARLRDPEDGCPWDLQQTFTTIAPYTIEEAHEVAEAIESNDLMQVKDELGDLLLQVVFHAQIAKQEGAFDFDQVAEGLVQKMVRRHPHVFPDGTLTSRVSAQGQNAEDENSKVDRIKSNWESIKKQEQAEKGESSPSALDGIPKGLPAVPRAVKLQKKAARVGFDWPEADGAVEKLKEELLEFTSAYDEAVATNDKPEEINKETIADELGDIMFSCINVARLLRIDADAMMRGANRKFENRFRQMETSLAESGQSLEEMTLVDMEAAWQLAKRKLGHHE